METTRQILYVTLIIGFTVLVVLLGLVLLRLFDILRDVKAITKSARRTGRVAEILASRVIGPISTVLGGAAGVRKGAEVLVKRKSRKRGK
jgi:hypothetical protein